MRTFPLRRNDGEIFAFEIYASGLWTGSLARLLRRTSGVTNVRRVFDGDNRLVFKVRDEAFVVFEPFGDNSGYWVGPCDTTVTSGNASHLESQFRSTPIWSEGLTRVLGGLFGGN